MIHPKHVNFLWTKTGEMQSDKMGKNGKKNIQILQVKNLGDDVMEKGTRYIAPLQVRNDSRHENIDMEDDGIYENDSENVYDTVTMREGMASLNGKHAVMKSLIVGSVIFVLSTLSISAHICMFYI